jgi:hypothetical protein
VAAVVPQAVYSLLAGLFVHTTHSPVPAASLFLPVRHWAHTCTFPLSIAVVLSRSVPAPHAVQSTLAVPVPSHAPATPWPSGQSVLPAAVVWPWQGLHSRWPSKHRIQKPAPHAAALHSEQLPCLSPAELYPLMG